MHVCICNDFNQKAVEDALRKHPESGVDEKTLYRAITGEPPRCGQCLDDLKKIILAQSKQILPPG